MTERPPLPLQSDNLDAAIQWAEANPQNRWYVARVCRNTGHADLIPETWGEVSSDKPAARRIMSDDDNLDHATIGETYTITDRPAEDVTTDEPPAVTAALGKKRRTQKVQTEAGVKRYNAPIGTPIILKDGKLVADLHAAVRLDDNNAVVQPRQPNNVIRPTNVASLEEGDEIRAKDDIDHVIISNKPSADGRKHVLTTSDADGRVYQFTIPTAANIRLIEDDDDLDDDAPEDEQAPERTTPDEVAANKAAYLAAKKGAARGEKGVTPAQVKAAREKMNGSVEQLDRQIVAPGERMKPKPKPEPEPDVEPEKTPEPEKAAEPPTPEPEKAPEPEPAPPAAPAGPRGTKSKAYADAYDAYLKRASELDGIAAIGGRSYTARMAADPKIAELRAVMDEELRAAGRRVPTGRSAYPASNYNPNARPPRATTPPPAAPAAPKPTEPTLDAPTPEPTPPAPAAPTSKLAPRTPEEAALDARVEDAFFKLKRTSDYVQVTRMRDELNDVPREQLDEALRRVSRDRIGSLIPEENQKTLSDQNREDAVTMGNQQNHLLAIETRRPRAEAPAAPVAPEPAPAPEPEKTPEPTPEPEAPAAATEPEAAPETPAVDLSGKKDATGQPLSADSSYLIGRGGKQWKIAKRNADGSFDLVATDPGSDGRNNRYKVPSNKLKPVGGAAPAAAPAAAPEKPAAPAAPKPAPEAPAAVEAPAVETPDAAEADGPTAEELAAVGKDSKRQAIKPGARYTLNTRKGAQQWIVESIDQRGKLTLRPANGGPRRRHNIASTKMVPVSDTAAAPAAPTRASDKVKDMAARARAAKDAAQAAPAPDPEQERAGAAESVQQQAAIVSQAEQDFLTAGSALDTATRRRDDADVIRKLTADQLRAERTLIMARRDYAESATAAEAAGIADIPRPTSESTELHSLSENNIARTVNIMGDTELQTAHDASKTRLQVLATEMMSPAKRNERDGHRRVVAAAEATMKARGTWVEPPPEPVVEDTRGYNADPEYLEGLPEPEFLLELAAARDHGSDEVKAAVDREDRRRDELLGTLPPENFYALTIEDLESRIAAGTDDDETTNAILDELFAREDDNSQGAQIMRRIEGGENPWLAEAEVTGVPVDKIQRREVLRLLHEEFPVTAGNNNFAEALDTAYKLELREEITRSAEVGGFSQYFSNAAERRFGVQQSDILWTQNEATARANASEELREYWDANGRLTKTLFRERLLARIGAHDAGNGSYRGSSNGDFLQ